MKWLADENIPKGAIAFLRQHGEDVVTIYEDDKMLEGMITQMDKTTAQANAAIDKALEFIEASNKRIAMMEQKAA
jgi:hypothetical protein